jgi:integrase
VAEVFAIADAMPRRWRALVLLAAFTSLRWGELIALRRRHFDLEAGFVSVKMAVTETDGELTVGTVKSAAGVRDVGIPAAIIPELREHLDGWAERGSSGRVFVGERGATPRRRNFNRLWKQATKKAGIDREVGLHLHDLRHTGNQLAEGSLKDRMARMGHSTVRAALIYLHTDRDRERQIAERLSAVIEAGRQGNGHVAGTTGGQDGRRFRRWRRWDSNPRPPACKAGALAS